MSTTPNLGLAYIAADQNQKEVTVNADLLGIDQALCQQSSFEMGDADVDLTLAQAQGAMSFLLEGTNTAERNLFLPQGIQRPYIVRNETAGGYAVLVSAPGSPSGATVSVANGTCQLLYCDGVNVVQVGS